jgi:ABC-type protease/lipase transport system fused ATPase/permease subunit
VVVTHRPQLLASADRIVSLRDGALIAAGPRDEMLRKFVGTVGVGERTRSSGGGTS